jgi:hypothetical protein
MIGRYDALNNCWYYGYWQGSHFIIKFKVG